MRSGFSLAGGEFVDLSDVLGVDGAGDALVDGGGVHEPVAEDDLAGVERGLDELAGDLGARGGEEEELGLGAMPSPAYSYWRRLRMASPSLCAPGSRTLCGCLPSVLSRSGEPLDLCGFAGAFAAFEGDVMNMWGASFWGDLRAATRSR